MNLTDEQIIKALECCSNKEVHFCTLCPMFIQDKENDFCQEDLAKKALNLINRQKAEIENLKKEIEWNKTEKWILEEDIEKAEQLNDSLSDDIDRKLKVIYKLHEELKTTKSEARKEFAERLKDKFQWQHEDFSFKVGVYRRTIDNLLEEMEKENVQSRS